VLRQYEYYRTKNGVVYCADCLAVMPSLEPVDLVLTDPPYGIKEAAGRNLQRGHGAKDYGNLDWDNSIPCPEIFEMILNQSNFQIIFGGNYFVEHLKNSSCWLVWDKKNGSTDFADCELAWTNFTTAVRKFEYRWNGYLQESCGKYKEKRYHPTQKPVGLFLQILLRYAEQGWTVLDPFAGSGTTGLACEKMGNIQYILIEREEQYCEIIARRLDQELKQLKLF